MTSVDNHVMISSRAVEVHHAATTAISRAYHWMGEADTVDALRERARLVQEMERSWLSNVAHLVMGPQAHDGALTIERDGELSLYWRYAGGYHGGLIFHANHRVGEVEHGGERFWIGTWSIHT